MLFQGLGLDEQFEVELVKEARTYFDAFGGSKHVTTEVPETGGVMGAIFMDLVGPSCNASDIPRISADIFLQGVESSSDLPVLVSS